MVTLLQVALLFVSTVSAQDVGEIPEIYVPETHECTALEWDYRTYIGERSLSTIFEFRSTEDEFGNDFLGSVTFAAQEGAGSSGTNGYGIPTGDSDAEEEAAAVTLTGTSLALGDGVGSTAGTESTRVLRSEDDCRADAGQTPRCTATSIQLGNQSNYVEFFGVDIDQGATITSAVIEFVPKATITSTTQAHSIYGADEDTASGVIGGVADAIQNYSPVTSANVSWDMDGTWTAETVNAESTTPDLTAIVQEIVNRGGWASGNNMGFILLETGTGGAKNAHSFESDPGKAPRLVVDYTTGGVGGSVTTFFRFTGVTKPASTDFVDARLYVYPDVTQSVASAYTVYGEDADAAAAATTSTGNLSSRLKTSQSASWALSAQTQWLVDQVQQVNVWGPVSEVTARGGWSGTIAFIVEGTGRRTIYSREADPLKVAVLQVDYVPSGQQGTYQTLREADDGSGGHWYRMYVDSCPTPVFPRDQVFYLSGRAITGADFGPWSEPMKIEAER